MATFTVKRSEWYRGKGDEESKLLREDGKRCCIGFVGQQCGFSDEDLLNVSAVGRTRDYDIFDDWPSWMRKQHGLDVSSAYEINDSGQLTDEEREAKLKEIFTRNGDEIVFVD